jgi:hypothetical protein
LTSQEAYLAVEYFTVLLRLFLPKKWSFSFKKPF